MYVCISHEVLFGSWHWRVDLTGSADRGHAAAAGACGVKPICTHTYMGNTNIDITGGGQNGI